MYAILYIDTQNPKMITLDRHCENGARYFHFEEGNTIIRMMMIIQV